MEIQKFLIYCILVELLDDEYQEIPLYPRIQEFLELHFKIQNEMKIKPIIIYLFVLLRFYKKCLQQIKISSVGSNDCFGIRSDNATERKKKSGGRGREPNVGPIIASPRVRNQVLDNDKG